MTPSPIHIRSERPADVAAIDALNRAAFGGPDEADLVTRLRDDGLNVVSLVAEGVDAVIGHILFSRLAVAVDGRQVNAVALAPMAVSPPLQRQGIGSRLVVAGIRAAKERADAIVVVGHPGFYPRFGFSSALAAKLACPFAGDAFMALALRDGALDGARGSVVYPAAFGL